MTPIAIVAYLALFISVGFLFVLASLLLGWLVRAHAPNAQKNDTYECGEPAVGPGTVQFDLRFYVVALLFLIFEVEVAFFFPPATIFGKATHQMAANNVAARSCASPEDSGVICSDIASSLASEKTVLTPFSATTLARAAMVDLGIFFGVLLVGFAYVWRCGDLDWVRAVRHPSTAMAKNLLVTSPRENETP